MISSHQKSETAWQEILKQQSFSWAFFKIVLHAAEQGQLPDYKGSMLRGGFGAAFRKVSCTNFNMECRSCMMNRTCPYAYIFETPNTGDNNVSHQAENLPHPFVIEPPESGQNHYSTGDELVFSLLLFGKAVPFLPYFIYAFDRMANRGLGTGKIRFHLSAGFAHQNLENHEELMQIYDGDAQLLNGNFHTWNMQELNTPDHNSENMQLTIRLITPARLVQHGKLVQSISFELFVRNLLRRVSLLAKIHCQSDWNVPYAEILKSARHVRTIQDNTQWFDWTRYSSRQKRRMKLGGLVGTIVFEGDISPFLPLLMLGQYTHFGKNATFGLGKYRLEIRN